MSAAPRIVEGGPIWIDLSTHDIDAAVAFYQQMFGWEIVDSGPEFGGYRMISAGGKSIGGMMSSLMGPDGPADEPQGPSAWTVYLHTNDIASVTDRTSKAGGAVVVPPMDVGPLGKMACVTDPAGAFVGFWQPGEFSGTEAVAGPGLPCWFECMTRDFDASLAYYRDVAGWDVHWMGEGPDGSPAHVTEKPARTDFLYVTHGGDEGVAGLYDASAWLPEDAPSYWRIYLGVDDVDTALEKLTDLGGTVLDGPMDSPFGRLATVRDPHGAQFQIITNVAQ